MNILCICPIGIGNYLLCYPAWVALNRHLPDAKLHLLALRKPILDLASGDPLWNEVHCIEPTKQPNLLKILGFIMHLRACTFSASIVFFPSNTWQYNLLPFLAGIKKRYAFRYFLKRIVSLSFLNTNLHPVDIQLHDVFQNLAIIAGYLKMDVSGEPVRFPELVTDREVVAVDAILPKGKYFAVHPGSSSEHGMDAKRWPPDRFGIFCDRIGKETGATVLILGGSDEQVLKEATASYIKCPFRIIEPQSLRITAAILKKCILCLCNDSGIMHLAACSGIPVIAFFGPTDERRNGPFGKQHYIIRKPLEGFPLWTAANVGVRYLPPGINPRDSLLTISVDDAWKGIAPFIRKMNL